MLGQSGKLWIRPRAGQDLGIASGDGPAAFALERSRDDAGSASSRTGLDEVIDELDEIVWQANGDLLTHTIMVPNWYRQVGRITVASLDPAGSYAASLNPCRPGTTCAAWRSPCRRRASVARARTASGGRMKKGSCWVAPCASQKKRS